MVVFQKKKKQQQQEQQNFKHDYTLQVYNVFLSLVNVFNQTTQLEKGTQIVVGTFHF